MRIRRFSTIDVFSAEPFMGNPVAVVLDGTDLDDGQRQRFANWTNLSETTFVEPPTDAEADYAVRIFTPSSELPFAGHPTLGTAHAWLSAGNEPRQPGMVVQQCAAGLVPIRVDGDVVSFRAPPLMRSGAVDAQTRAAALAQIGVDESTDEVLTVEWVDNGPGWVGVVLADPTRVAAIRPVSGDLFVGVCAWWGAPGRGVGPDGADLEVRAFFHVNGETREDPVTGSLNASLGQYFAASEPGFSAYVARQGSALGRLGLVRVEHRDDAVWVGGSCHVCVNGTVSL